LTAPATILDSAGALPRNPARPPLAGAGSEGSAMGGTAAATAITPRILAAAANGVVDAIMAHGADPDRVLGAAAIHAAELNDPMRELTLARYCAMFEAAARQTRDDNFGLHFGHGFTPRQLGTIGYVAISSPTLAAGLRNMSRYFAAHQESSLLALRVSGEVATLEYQVQDGRIACRRQDAELSLGMFCNVFWHCLGRSWQPLEIHFEHPRPLDGHEHAQLFRAPTYFARPTNAIVFHAGDLDAVMHSADAYLLTLLEPMLRDRLARANTDDLVGLVRRAIERGFAGSGPDSNRVAGDLGMTGRTLHRRLQERGCSFTELVRASRRELALQYLAMPHIPLTEIAFLLGYSELSAFSRAFHQWAGLAPMRYRKQRLAAAAAG
jgi:AraC-like DNA-binding protein